MIRGRTPSASEGGAITFVGPVSILRLLRVVFTPPPRWHSGFAK